MATTTTTMLRVAIVELHVWSGAAFVRIDTKRWFGLVKSAQVVYTAEFCSMRGREVLQERLGAVLGERLLAKLAA